MTMALRTAAAAALAAALCAAGFRFKGFDPAYPDAWPDAGYRQAKINEQLSKLGWRFRVYQSRYDGSCLAARLGGDGEVESLRYSEEDGREPSLALGCRRLTPGDRQDLSIYGDTILLKRDDGEMFYASEDPYRQVGRYERSAERLEIDDRSRVGEILREALRDRGPAYARAVERALTEKVHELGDLPMERLSGEGRGGRWRYWVKVRSGRPDDRARLFYEDGR